MEPIHRVGKRDKNVSLSSGKVVNCTAYCPRCGGGPMDGATQIEISEEERMHEKKSPKNGDFSICAYCGGIYVFTQLDPQDPITLSIPTENDMDRMKEDAEQWEIVQEVCEHFKSRGLRPSNKQ